MPTKKYQFVNSRILAQPYLGASVAYVRAALRAGVCAGLGMAVTGCGTLPVARTDGHLKNAAPPEVVTTVDGARVYSAVPQPVRQVPLPPPPLARVEEVKYSVTVNNVPAQELLFAISRDTKVNIDVHPGI